MTTKITLKLSDRGRRWIKGIIDAYQMMDGEGEDGGPDDMQCASFLQVLLDIHDQVHGIKEQDNG